MTDTNRCYKIRNYVDADADKIGEFDVLSKLAYRYNKDYQPDNIFCAVDSEDRIYGAGHIVPDQTWWEIDKSNKPSDFVYKLNLDITLNPQFEDAEHLKNDLFESGLNRAKIIRDTYPGKIVRVSHIISSDDLEEIDFYLAKGFDTSHTHLIMKRDLTEEIPEYPLPDGLEIMKWDMAAQAEQEQYLTAEAEGDLYGVSWSLNHLQWTRKGKEWDTFTIFDGDQVVGSVMTWGIGPERGATENIFVLPNWRRKGIAKAVITEALKFLKAKGKTEATLSVYGKNGRAISLYKSLGYRMLFINLEFGLNI